MFNAFNKATKMARVAMNSDAAVGVAIVGLYTGMTAAVVVARSVDKQNSPGEMSEVKSQKTFTGDIASRTMSFS